MTESAYILLVGSEEDATPEVREVLDGRRPLRIVRDVRELEVRALDAAELVVITEPANRADRSLRPWLRDRSTVPVMLLRSEAAGIPRCLRFFDDAGFAEPIEDLVARVDLLLSFREMGRRADSLGVSPDDLRAELVQYALDPGLIGPAGLIPPGRVSLHRLVDIEAVNRQQGAICRLMGTSSGTFLHSFRPRGLPTADGRESPPTGVLSPFCAYLSSQGQRCESSEYRAAVAAMAKGEPLESTCAGGLRIYTVPVCLTLKGITWPLYAASVAVGGLPDRETIDRVAEEFGVNPEILGQIGEESRFWLLNPDKVGEIKETLTNLAETISREVGHKYSVAYQLVHRILTEREVRRSQRLLGESHRDLKETNRRLRLKNEEVYEVTHAITHDLRKPLVSLKAVFGIMSDGRLGELNDTQQEAVDTAREATDYMHLLVGDLLEAARLEAGRKHLEIGPVSTRPLFARIAKRFRIQLEEVGVSLEITALPETIACDEGAMEKVFMNLIGNSVSYIGEGEKRIVVEGSRVGDEVRISVRDTGIGIPARSIDQVFDKFQRGGNVSGIRGTGLGLAIVRGVVEAHGGRVSLSSVEAEGTEVTITLPCGNGGCGKVSGLD